MNIEMRGAVELVGSARSDLGVLLHVEDQWLTSFLARKWTADSLHLASTQLPEPQQKCCSSLPGAGQ